MLDRPILSLQQNMKKNNKLSELWSDDAQKNWRIKKPGLGGWRMKTSRRHPAPLHVEEQWFYWRLLPGDSASRPDTSVSW